MTTRREFLAAATCTAAAFAAPLRALAQKDSPFHISVITDEISNDFDHACSVAANDFGLQWVEILALWSKNIGASTPTTSPAHRRSSPNTICASPTSPAPSSRWIGPAHRAPTSARTQNFPPPPLRQAGRRPGDVYRPRQQLRTDKIRCFDFWRIEDAAPYRAAIDEKLRSACETAGKQGIALVLENEQDCNTATAPEAVRLLAAVPGLNLNWDPANAVYWRTRRIP